MAVRSTLRRSSGLSAADTLRQFKEHGADASRPRLHWLIRQHLAAKALQRTSERNPVEQLNSARSCCRQSLAGICAQRFNITFGHVLKKLAIERRINISMVTLAWVMRHAAGRHNPNSLVRMSQHVSDDSPKSQASPG